jgi:hypothetical protein
MNGWFVAAAPGNSRYGRINDNARGQLGLEQEEAEALGAELDELDLVRVGGGHSVWLTERGRQACQRAIKKSDVLRPSRGSGTGRAKVPGGRSRC